MFEGNLEEPLFLIYFQDQDVGPEMFTDRSAAIARFDILRQSWTCHLFEEIARDT